MLFLPTKIAISLALLSSFTVAAPSQWHSARNRTGLSVGKAIYFLTNEAENAVVALPIEENGMLSKGTVTNTGGAGSNSINAMTGEAALTDPLISQSALTVAGNVCQSIQS
jgi:cytidine deaminase